MKRAKKVVEKTSNQGMLLLQPYFAMGLVGALSVVLWLIGLKANYTAEIAASLGISTSILSLFTWKASQDRREFGRFHSLLSMIASGGFIMAMVIAGPSPSIFLVWLLGGLTLGLSWNIRHAIRSEPREDPIDKFFTDAGMPGTRYKFTKRGKDTAEGVINLKRGSNTVDDLQKLQPRLASLFGAPANGVRIRTDADDSSKAYFKLVKRDLLKETRPYVWLDEKLTPNDPMTIGWYEDGTPEQFSLHSKHLGAVHMLIQGMNGSGKSEAAKVIFAEAFKRSETEMWVIDITKGEQTLGVVMPYLDWVITQEKIADLLFKKFPKLVKARADYLGRKRLAKWEPGCGLSFIYLHVEEASGLIANNPAFIKMMETARSVGIQITASLQRASHVAVDTAARAQFSSVLCFGVADISDATFALPDEVTDAGANPAIWKNKRQGYNYLVHPDADDEYWTTPARTLLIENEELEEAGKNRLPHETDPVTLGALGDLYQAELDEDPGNDEEELDDLYPEEEREEVEDDLEALEELKAKHDVLLEFDKPVKMPAEEAKAVLEEALQDLRAQGTEFEAPKLADVLLVTGLSRAWLYKQLQVKVDGGELEKEDATYKFPPNLRKRN
jgi:DNA segregation ATPase FtsK/SpoIIIE-like protein